MAADTTYPSVVQIRQDGNAYAPTGKSINVEDGGQISLPVTAGTTTANISNFGVSTISSTVAQGYTLDDPDQAGLLKVIACTAAGTSDVDITVTCSAATITGATTEGSNPTIITFQEPGTVTLISTSTALWHVQSVHNADSVVAFTSAS